MAKSMKLPGSRSAWIEHFDKHDFEVDGTPVTVVCPEKARDGMPWAWKGEFLNAFPDTELSLLREGFHIAYLRYPDRFGCPAAVEKWNRFYDVLTGEFDFSRKPALIGLSRGALYCYQWAIANPSKVACIYGDAPVCDMRSWPGGKGQGTGSPADWEKVLEIFGFASELDAMRSGINPVDNLAPLALNNVPILHVYGDSDDVVPWLENTGVVAHRYRKLGGTVELIGKPGCGHHPHGLADCSPIIQFIIKHTADSMSI